MRTHIKRLSYLAGACLLVLGQAAWAAGANQMGGSAHDFTGDAWAGNDWCTVCHTPHNPDAGVSDAPLWDHTVSTTNFTPYGVLSSGTNLNTGPQGVSLLCMSCHDGVTNMDAYGAQTGGNVMAANLAATLGDDMGNNHPVSMQYDAAAGLEPASGGLVGNTLPLFGGSNDQIECASCHDVHNGAGGTFLLRMANTDGALCQTCHLK